MPDGNVYEGERNQGLMHGTGYYKFNDGSEYKGMYLNGKRHGYGVYIWDSNK